VHPMTRTNSKIRDGNQKKLALLSPQADVLVKTTQILDRSTTARVIAALRQWRYNSTFGPDIAIAPVRKSRNGTTATT
jgi:hypothetical protein